MTHSGVSETCTTCFGLFVPVHTIFTYSSYTRDPENTVHSDPYLLASLTFSPPPFPLFSFFFFTLFFNFFVFVCVLSLVFFSNIIFLFVVVFLFSYIFFSFSLGDVRIYSHILKIIT